MIIGMNPLTFIHVVISLVAIATGFVALYGLLNNKRLETWTTIFLATTVATSVTGFLFPFVKFLPSHAFGISSLLILPVAYYARYVQRLVGRWRWVYIISAMLALYLNVFVLIVQAFLKIQVLHDLAPTQQEPPFLIAQLANLVIFMTLTILAIKRFQPVQVVPGNTGEIRTA
ncbi:MAG: hypothetical protein JNJ77_11460 [Planctomycetia bacterium]|nr:hypothetical protein [Planctomycetia bacterium]